MTVTDLIESLQALPPDQPIDWTLPDLADGIPTMFRAQNQLAALRMDAIAAFDARGGAQIGGYRTTADWLGATTGISQPGGMVNTARALRDELTHTAAALAAGDISEEHLTAIRRAHRMLAEDFPAFEKTVVDYATTNTVKNLRGYTDLLINQYRPDDFDDDAETRRDKRKLYLSRSLDGWWHLTGLLDPETGEHFQAALDVYADRADDTDPRSPAQRRTDALTEIADKAVADINRTSGRGNVLIKISTTTTPDTSTTDSDTDTEDSEPTKPDPADNGPGPWPPGTTITPTNPNWPAGTTATWPSGTLMTRPDLAKTTCNAQITTIIGTGTTWQPLAAGTTERFASPTQRLALQARDGDTCIHEHCTVPANRTIAHHLIHWADGGPTDIWNLGLFCGHHHDHAHKGKLTIIINPNGSYTAKPRRA